MRLTTCDTGKLGAITLTSIELGGASLILEAIELSTTLKERAKHVAGLKHVLQSLVNIHGKALPKKWKLKSAERIVIFSDMDIQYRFTWEAVCSED